MPRSIGLIFLLLGSSSLFAASPVIVENGEPRAEIVIAPRRPRMATLAALELRHFVEKLSGARLPIVTEPSQSDVVKIYVGRSAETDRLGMKPDDLKFGAYRIASGPGRVVLLGRDQDFDPTKLPWPLSRKDAERRALAEWNQATAGATDASWGFAFGSGFKAFWNPSDFTKQMTARYGDDFGAMWTRAGGGPQGFWDHDLGGSLNAVYALLRGYGVRWYMPGELGEVVPQQTTLVVEPIECVRHESW